MLNSSDFKTKYLFLQRLMFKPRQELETQPLLTPVRTDIQMLLRSYCNMELSW